MSEDKYRGDKKKQVYQQLSLDLCFQQESDTLEKNKKEKYGKVVDLSVVRKHKEKKRKERKYSKK